MEINALAHIRDCASIYSSGEHIVVLGKFLWILGHDGQVLHRRKDILYPYKATILSGNRVLIGQDPKAAYRMISLPEGKDLWTVPPIRMDSYGNTFTISPDEKFAYDCYDRRLKNHLVKLDLQTGNVMDNAITGGFRCVSRIACNEEGTPCLLQTHYDEREDGRISQNGIRYPLKGRFSARDSINWKYAWQHSGQRIAKFFMGSTSCVLTNDLFVYDLENKREYFLLENDPKWEYPDLWPMDCWLDPQSQYLFIMYDDVNVVIDWAKRKMVARYVGKCTRGALICNEYWISKGEGIRRAPFPVIEDIPPQKNVFW